MDFLSSPFLFLAVLWEPLLSQLTSSLDTVSGGKELTFRYLLMSHEIEISLLL